MFQLRDRTHLRDLLGNAFPLFLNTSLTAACSLVFFKFIGSDHPDNHYLMSLYFPFSWLTTAAIESLKIPFYVNARAWTEKALLSSRLAAAVALGLLLLVSISAVAWLGREAILTGLSVAPEYQSGFVRYAAWMLLSAAPSLMLNLLTTVIFVRLGSRMSFAFNFAAMLLANGVGLALYFRTRDLASLGIAIFATMAVAFAMTLVYLLRRGLVAMPVARDPFADFRSYAGDFVRYSAPYALTFAVYAVYNYGLNTIITGYGRDLTAVFGIFTRLQNTFILPAVALGTYTAVKVTSLPWRNARRERFLLRIGLSASLLVYLPLVVVAFFFREGIAGVFTREPALIELFYAKFPWILAATFLLGPIVFVISFLEQSGRALKTLFLNLVFLSGELCLLFLINAKYADVNTVLTSLVSFKLFSILCLARRRLPGVPA